jgi:hypothetical protein
VQFAIVVDSTLALRIKKGEFLKRETGYFDEVQSGCLRNSLHQPCCWLLQVSKPSKLSSVE